MSDFVIPTDHELVQIKPGKRTGLPIMIGVHSTVLGPAIGGLRIKEYASSSDGLSDVLRLSQAMTIKAAANDNGTGGGKTVVPLPQGIVLTPALRESILLDVADEVHSLNGIYHVAPDVGTGPSDIDIVRRRTPYVGGYSKDTGGAGGTTYGTFIGLESALRCAVLESLGYKSLTGLRVSIVGLGGIGTLLARTLHKEGATLIVSDIDYARKALADELGAKWATPEDAMLAEVDVLSPCALGGVLTPENIVKLRARIICGAANNQLTIDSVADQLLAREIVYVPDVLANAGGLIYASGIEVHHRSEATSNSHTRTKIADNVAKVLKKSRETGVSTQTAALEIAHDRLGAARPAITKVH